MRFTALLLRSVLVALPVTLVSAVFEDEAYSIDYQHELLGTPIQDNTLFHRPSTSSKATLLYSLSDKNILGAINPKDGSLVWRQDLSGCAPGGTPGFLRSVNGTNMVLSVVGSTVRAWEAGDGKMVWQFEGRGIANSLVVSDIMGKTQDPVLLTDEDGIVRITALNAMNGKVVWEAADVYVRLVHAGQRLLTDAVVTFLLRSQLHQQACTISPLSQLC